MNYDPEKIEKKWQAIWEKIGLFHAKENRAGAGKFYGLVEFPYPSGDGLHTGHPRSYTAMDIICRKRRMEGYSVLYPIGFDSFGLPTENYAIKRKVNPKIITKENIAVFTRQLKSLGFSFDWSRVLSTSDPEYYKWTQWIFIKLFEHGLAYKAKENINWCTSCKIGLANEEVVGGVCERCGGEVIKKEREQWILKITKYADRLIDDLKNVDYLDRIKEQQINWIGRSIGATIKFEVRSSKFEVSENLEIFTTRPDTIFGATFLVISPEHELLKNKDLRFKNYEEIEKYTEEVKKASPRLVSFELKKTGVEIKGIKAINPATKKEIPIFVADYVSMDYGTGAIMAVPGHDERDFDFAKKYNLPIITVVETLGAQNSKFKTQNHNLKLKNLDINFESDTKYEVRNTEYAYVGDGTSVNSGILNGLETKEAIEKAIKLFGEKTTNYHLRDWIFSRQRYWGEPIPLIFCEKCATQKPIILLIHGIYGHSKENWFPWFKQEMENKGFEVIIPDLPNAENPEIKEWVNVLKRNFKGKLNKELIIVSHSLGAPAVCKFIDQENIKLKKLILVAPTGKNQGEQNLKNLKKVGASEEAIKSIHDFNNENIDYKKIKKLSEKIVIYFSDNDPYVPVSVQENYKDLEADVKIFKGKGHFNAAAGVTEFPGILEEFSDIKVDKNSGWVAVPEKDLPVELPEIKDFMPTKDGDSPLAKAKDWVKTKCPKCGGDARRETDVMPNWAGSNWYFLAYAMLGMKNEKLKVKNENHKSDITWDKEKLKYWTPVDWYNGGMEHTTLHLLYSRFIYKFLYDIGVVPKECGSEPYKKRTAHGMILGEGGIKMSKSKGNVINPDDYVKEYGADTVRLYEMFMGPFDQAIPWEGKSVIGVNRFLSRVWELGVKFLTPSGESLNQNKYDSGQALIVNRESHENIERLLNQTIKKVGEDIEQMKFNTAVSQMMILLDEMEKTKDLAQDVFEKFLIILSPFAPHITEEIWQSLRAKSAKRKVQNKDSKFPSYAKASAGKQIPNSKFKSISEEPWPEYDEKILTEETFNLVVQVNGKVREMIECPIGISESEAKEKALSSSKIIGWTRGKEIVKVIYVQDKLINFVVK